VENKSLVCMKKVFSFAALLGCVIPAKSLEDIKVNVIVTNNFFFLLDQLHF